MTTRTVYRLLGVQPTLDGLLNALPLELLDDMRFGIEPPPNFTDDVPAVLVAGDTGLRPASWCAFASSLTGVALDLGEQRTAGLLLLAVDTEVFAIGFGQGFRLVPEELKDPTFGLRVAVRAIDPQRVHDIVRRAMTGRPRLDATNSYEGLPIESIGLRRHAELVRRLGGELLPVDLGLQGRRPVKIDGSAGLRLPLPVNPDELIACLRSLIRICAGEPRPGLAFIEAVQPIAEQRTLAELDSALEVMLRSGGEVPIQLSVPTDLVPLLGETSTFTVRVGNAARRGRPDLDLDADVLGRVRVQPAGTGVRALRDGRIDLLDSSGTVLGCAPAIRWIEAFVNRGARHYFLLEGRWYEGGAAYLEQIRSQVEELLDGRLDPPLPPWLKGETERQYNQRVQDHFGRATYLNLDRTSVRTALHTGNGIEVCDLYGPGDALICVKPASRSAPLSHQFNQALVAVETLFHQQDAREAFNALVEERSDRTRSAPPNSLPTKIVFAIHLKSGATLTPGTLFPFAQIALVNMAITLRQYVEVEVIGIPAA